MGDYRNKTKEELLDIIYHLEQKLERCSIQDNPCENNSQGQFRERYAREILETIPDMITVFDYDANCVALVSAPGTNHIEGLSNEGLCCSKLEDIVTGDAYDVIFANMEEVKRTKETHTAQHSLIFEGELHYFDNRICPLGDQYLLCVCQDVTRRVKSEFESAKQQQEIVRLNSIMGAILDNIPVYLFVKDAKDDFRYLYWNKDFVKHSGISAEKAVGHTDFEIFPDSADRERFRKDDLETQRLGFKEFEEVYTSANGDKRIVHTSKLMADSPNGDSYLIGISWDITGLKQTEKELIAARERAEESDRLKSAFLANMSHEIRTPLNAIVGFSRLVINPGDETEKEEYSYIIEKNSELLLNLFNDIIDLSSLEAGVMDLSKEEINLYTIFTKEYNQFYKKTAKGVQLKLDEVERNLCIVSDKIRLTQILTNLLSNAIKFTVSGEIHFGCQLRGDVVQFYVKDSGIGIAANRIATIFQRFGKVDNFAQGTGLGLTICRMLVELMGGRIWARSTEGVGTAFYFTLPLSV
ncbi:ATP-binding protein [Bacteroides sp.]|uniref:sensor histidine kinase n=1 Tax=Bacteroides sp. TaxID=29523 RepID=UPI00260B2BF0|nr:ATP-binding protein [Bacteroides sp.]